MTRNNIFSKISKKLVWVLALITIFSFAAFSISCGSDKADEPNYTYTDTNDGLISNPTFSYGTSNLALTSYPKTSVTGWTRSYDTTVSYVNSGIVDVTEKGWKELLGTLYKDNEFFVYTSNQYGYSKEQAKNEIIADKGQSDYVPTTEEISAWIVDKYLLPNFTSPSTHQGATDSKVYMLNNYGRISADLGVGTSQKITSSSSVSLNKGEYGKFTVWIKTQNLAYPIQSNPNYGANIRITSTFNGNNQSEYKITNIISNDEWTQYTVYVKADDTYECSVTLALGLGDGKRDVTEGTAYFDDITFTHLTADEFATETATSNVNTSLFAYSQTSGDAINVKDNAVNADAYLYDMTLDAYLANSGLVGTYVNDITFDNNTVTGAYTTSNIDNQNGNKDNGQSTITFAANNEYVKANLTKAGYTITINDTSAFTVAPESYAYVEFDILNNLSKFSSTNITVDVFDIFGSEIEKRAAVVSLTEVSDTWTKCGILVKNNFLQGNRQFYINVVIGPTDVANAVNLVDYASGEVSISAPVISKGLIEVDETTAETELFSLYSATANGTTALYAGYSSDYTESDDSENYSLTYSPSDIGVITHSPANSNLFTGVVSDHVYIKDATDTTLATDVNTRSGNGDNGSFAGVVNTKYADAYKQNHGFDLSTELDYNAKNNIQPIMIYNSTLDAYGFINKGSTIASGSFAKISVDVRVTGSAVAYVYLTDISGTDKSIMTFNDFTTNATSDKSSVALGTEIKGEDLKLQFAITSDMMEDNGWLTVNFYVAAGATAKDYRVEVWNGSRDGDVKSQGFVFFNNVSTSGSFVAPEQAATAFTQSGNPLYNAGVGAFDASNLLVYERPLSDLEKEFNKEYTDKQVSYLPNFVWAMNESMIYADFRSVDPVENDPYAGIDDDEDASGCASNADPSAFWMSFSSILLAAVLIFAIVMLIVKNIRRNRKARASEAISHYNVTSRIKTKKKQPKAKKVRVEKEIEEEIEEEIVNEEEPVEEVIEEQVEETPAEEQTLDEYVYGEVQDFGDTTETNENKED